MYHICICIYASVSCLFCISNKFATIVLIYISLCTCVNCLSEKSELLGPKVRAFLILIKPTLNRLFIKIYKSLKKILSCIQPPLQHEISFAK